VKSLWNGTDYRAALLEESALLRADQELELARPLSTVEYRDRHRIAEWRSKYLEAQLGRSPPKSKPSVLGRLRRAFQDRNYFRLVNLRLP
jgi:DNA/RNA-binding domain of Phe-tRNA-synthetase-like protein